MQPVSSAGSAPGADAATVSKDVTANLGSDTTFHDALAVAAERLQHVEGHRYAKVTAGAREGQYINRSQNARNGEAFAIVRREGRLFHVYGSGADRVVVELPSEARDAAAKADQASPETTGGTAAQ